jgi:hypothetical protein
MSKPVSRKTPPPAFVSDLAECPRCGKAHQDVVFRMTPGTKANGACYATCPLTGAPVPGSLSLEVETLSDLPIRAYRRPEREDEAAPPAAGMPAAAAAKGGAA